MLGVAVLALVGCGTSGDALDSVSGAAVRTLSQVADSTLTVRSARALGAGKGAAGGVGEFDLATGFGYERLTAPSTVRSGAENVFLVFTPALFYVQPASGAVSDLPRGKMWLSGSWRVQGSEHGLSLMVSALESLDPQLLLDEVAWGALNATDLGQHVLNHVPLTEYRVTVDLGRVLSAAARSPGVSDAVTRELASSTASGRGGTRGAALVSIWIDGAGLIERIAARLPSVGLGGAVVSFTDFGPKIVDTVPPAAEVVRIQTLPSATKGTVLPWFR
jgi:hypothetical protein